MDARLALRSARHLAGLSQRALARRAGVSPSLVAALESGARPARWDTLVALLACCGLELTLTAAGPAAGAAGAAGPAAGADEDLAAYLRLSTGDRLYWSLGGRRSWRSPQDCPAWRELARLARQAVVLLAPEACPGVWLPECPAPLPVPVLATARTGRTLPEDLALVEVVGPAPSLRGTVPVGVSADWEVHALPPLAPELQRDPGAAARLRRAAELLDAQEGRDRQGRARPPHRSAQVRGECAWVMTRRRFSDPGLVAPDARDRRDWRLSGDASFRGWLLRNGYPIHRYGHRERGP